MSTKFQYTKIDRLQAGKIAAGSLAAILIAENLGLQYAASAGIVAFLTILANKKETLLLAAKRGISFIITILLAFVIFHFIGLHSLAFGIFMFFLVSISYYFNWHGAISVNAVIGTHLLTEKTISMEFVLNEALLVLIGTTIAMLLNSYMPKAHREIKKNIVYIEEKQKTILHMFADYLTHMQKSPTDHNEITALEQYLEHGLAQAIQNAHNELYDHAQYYVSYMEMRHSQCMLLHQIMHSLHAMTDTPAQAAVISEFIRHMGDSIKEKNNAQGLLDELQDIFSHMEEQALPVTRKEFENRAILYHILLDLDAFIILKKEFAESLTEEQIRIYWS